jgi:hypothetical protein
VYAPKCPCVADLLLVAARKVALLLFNRRVRWVPRCSQ